MDRSVATPVGGGTDQLLHEEDWSLYVDRAKVSTTACDHYCVIEEKDRTWIGRQSRMMSDEGHEASGERARDHVEVARGARPTGRGWPKSRNGKSRRWSKG